jgi:RNA polymerase sigma-70 factor, ECF subfamily
LKLPEEPERPDEPPQAPWVPTEESFAEVYKECRKGLLKYIGKFETVSQSVEDILQQTALFLWQRRARVKDPVKYLFRVAGFVMRTEAKRLTDEAHNVVSSDALSVDLATLARILMTDDSTAAADLEGVRRHCEALSEEQRTVLELHYWEKLTVDEISAQLSIQPDTVKKRLKEITEHFRQYFGRDAIPKAASNIAKDS